MLLEFVSFHSFPSKSLRNLLEEFHGFGIHLAVLSSSRAARLQWSKKPIDSIFPSHCQSHNLSPSFHNLMHTMSVAISLSTTNPLLFTFNQPFSIIPPLSSASYTLISLPSDQPALSSPPDFITVRSSMLPTGKAHQEDLRRLFSQPGPHVFKDATIPISLVGVQVIEFLLKQKARIRETDSLLKKAIPGCNRSQLAQLLRYAITFGNAEIVTSLIDGGADVDDVDSEGTSLISQAVQAGSIEILKILLASGASIKDEKSIKRTDYIVHKAASMNRVDLLEILFKGSDHIDANEADSDGNTPIHAAAAHGFVSAIKFLVSVGANADAVDSTNSTPLHIAALRGHSGAVECLLDCSTYSKHVVNNHGKTAFMLAAENGHSHLLDQLRFSDALHRAARVGDVHGVRRCIAEGADLNAKDQNLWTPLHRAAFKGRVECAKELLDHGACVDAADDVGYTPLQCAVEAGHMKVVLLLIAHGARANVKGLYLEGGSPLGASDTCKGGKKGHVLSRLCPESSLMPK